MQSTMLGVLFDSWIRFWSGEANVGQNENHLPAATLYKCAVGTTFFSDIKPVEAPTSEVRRAPKSTTKSVESIQEHFFGKMSSRLVYLYYVPVLRSLPAGDIRGLIIHCTTESQSFQSLITSLKVQTLLFSRDLYRIWKANEQCNLSVYTSIRTKLHSNLWWQDFYNILKDRWFGDEWQVKACYRGSKSQCIMHFSRLLLVATKNSRRMGTETYVERWKPENYI